MSLEKYSLGAFYMHNYNFINALLLMDLTKRELYVVLVLHCAERDIQELKELSTIKIKETTNLDKNVLKDTLESLKEKGVVIAISSIKELNSCDVDQPYIKIGLFYYLNKNWREWRSESEKLVDEVENLDYSTCGTSRDMTLSPVALYNYFLLRYKEAYPGKEYKTKNILVDKRQLDKVLRKLKLYGLPRKEGKKFIDWCFDYKKDKLDLSPSLLYRFLIAQYLNKNKVTKTITNADGEVIFVDEN